MTAQWPKPKSADEWEDMVADALRVRWSDPTAQRNGRSGQRQEGVDIFGRCAGRTAGAQAKNQDRIDAKVIRAEISKAEKFQPSLAQLFIVYAGARDAKLQEFVRQVCADRIAAATFEVHLLSYDDIQHDLGTRPELIEKYWSSFFMALAAAGRLQGAPCGHVLDAEGAVKRVWELPEIRDWAARIEANPRGGGHLHMRFEGTPSLDARKGTIDRCWKLALAENYPTHLVTIRRMAVDVDTGDLMLYDVVEDSWSPYIGEAVVAKGK